MNEITSFETFVKAVNETVERERRHAHIRWWFRGQADADWSLTPKIYRQDFEAKNEEERLSKERHLSRDFRLLSVPNRGQEEDGQIYFLQQHYGMPTRLLDWSLNPLVALYFAVDDRGGRRLNKDARLFILDAYKLVPKGEDGKGFGIATARRKEFKRAIERILGWDNSCNFPAFTFPVRPDHFDRRITLQHGCFTFHVPRAQTLKESGAISSFVIKHTAKEPLRGQLARLGVNRFAIFGDMDALAATLIDAYAQTPAPTIRLSRE